MRLVWKSTRGIEMFANVTNHPSAGWSAEQVAACEAIGGEVREFPMPEVPPDAGMEAVTALAAKIAGEVIRSGAKWALVQGEPTLVWAMLHFLQDGGVRCLAATTRREASVRPVGEGRMEKVSVFRFVGLREYGRFRRGAAGWELG